MFLNLGLMPSMCETIKLNAIPIAPLSPPYVKMTTYFQVRPYPKLDRKGMNTPIDINLAPIIMK